MPIEPVSVPRHPGSTSPGASLRLSRLRRRDTGPERAVRTLVFAAGYRYRVAFPVPGQRRRTIDIAFTRAKLAVFIDGCFWHGCPTHGVKPRANEHWWTAKLGANQARDRGTNDALVSLGWQVMRFWEHESPEEVSRAITDHLSSIAGVQNPRPIGGAPSAQRH